MAKTLQPGDKVRWSTSQGETEGVVESKLTQPEKVKGYTARASAKSPQYKVKSSTTGAEAIHKPDALRKT